MKFRSVDLQCSTADNALGNTHVLAAFIPPSIHFLIVTW